MQPSEDQVYVVRPSSFCPLSIPKLVVPQSLERHHSLTRCWLECGAITGALITAIALSPALRRCILRGLLFALQDTVGGEAPRVDGLQRYRGH